MCRVHLDLRIPQLRRQMDGESIQRGFRCVVGQSLKTIDSGAWVGMQSQRAENARKIDDASFRRLSDQRQQHLCELNRAEEVGIEGLAQHRSAYRAGVIW